MSQPNSPLETARRPEREAGLSRSEREVGLPLAVAVIVLVLLAVIGLGSAVGYRFFWAKPSASERLDVELERWRHHTQANPRDADGWVELGQRYLAKERYDEAEQAFRRAYDLDPRMNGWARYYLAVTDNLRGRYAEAELLLKQVVQEFRREPLARYQLAFARFQQKRYDQALGDLNYILTNLDGTLADVYHLRGLIYEKQGKPDLARADWRNALRFNPEFQPARDALARLGGR